MNFHLLYYQLINIVVNYAFYDIFKEDFASKSNLRVYT